MRARGPDGRSRIGQPGGEDGLNRKLVSNGDHSAVQCASPNFEAQAMPQPLYGCGLAPVSPSCAREELRNAYFSAIGTLQTKVSQLIDSAPSAMAMVKFSWWLGGRGDLHWNVRDVVRRVVVGPILSVLIVDDQFDRAILLRQRPQGVHAGGEAPSCRSASACRRESASPRSHRCATLCRTE